MTDTNCQRASQSLYETIAVSLFARLPPRALLAASPLARDSCSATFPRGFSSKRDCSQSSLTLDASKKVYTSLVQPLFDYADVAWSEISEGCCKELQRLQNRAARIILRRKTSKDTLRVLNWLSLTCRRKLHKCISA